MIRPRALLPFALAVLLAGGPAASQDPAPPAADAIEAALATARTRLEEARREGQAARHAAAGKRLALVKELAEARQAQREAEAEMAALRAEITRHAERRREHDAALAADARELKGLAATVGRGLDTLLQAEESSLVALQDPALVAQFRSLVTELGDRETVAEETLGAFLESLVRYVRESGRIARFEAEAADVDGRLRRVEICRFGQVAAFYREADRTGHLALAESGHWRSIPTGDAAALRPLFAAAPPAELSVPLDPSGGLAIRGADHGDGWLEHLRAGGPVMIPIGLVVLAAFFLIAERLRFVAGARRDFRQLAGCLEGRVPAAEIRRRIAHRPGPLARVLETVLTHPEGGPAAVDQAMHQAAPALERSLGLLGVLGTVAPFLGLLGTVTGLITTFQTLTAVGSNDPRLLAGGISEALITTQAGLMVAIPILLVHAYLSKRVDDLSDRLEDAAEDAAARPRTEDKP
ncbi:MAG: MotA/TolQ/ExbB proton channel family protein [Planctomycetes bacterium]|nr:MotA/TolQ/ExbB proton channel family protein [Planctomycetota bacterium]